MDDVPLLIEFAPQSSLYRERDLVSQLTIIRNGPAGTFVVFPGDVRVSLPTDQIIFADDTGGCAQVGFGGMRFTGLAEGRLIFYRVYELHSEEQLSPARSHTMMLEPHLVSSIRVRGRVVWSPGGPDGRACLLDADSAGGDVPDEGSKERDRAWVGGRNVGERACRRPDATQVHGTRT